MAGFQLSTNGRIWVSTEAELTDVYAMEEDFEDALKAQFHALVERAVS